MIDEFLEERLRQWKETLQQWHAHPGYPSNDHIVAEASAAAAVCRELMYILYSQCGRDYNTIYSEVSK